MSLGSLSIGVAAWLLTAAVAPCAQARTDADPINPPPTAKDWAGLGRLPDWSGVWTPDMRDQSAQVASNPPPWTPESAKQVEDMIKQEKAGHPALLFAHCLPESMPGWMLISHNALEILFSPGRVTMLGESDGNRLRRIYTDGRKHPGDPDETFHGHSIGHWERQTLVVDTVAVRPQTYIPITESVGVPNGGNMRVIERWHLSGADELHDEMEIIAPHVLAKPWKTTRIWYRQRKQKYDIVEGVCEEGNVTEGKDQYGNSVFVALPSERSESAPRERPLAK